MDYLYEPGTPAIAIGCVTTVRNLTITIVSCTVATATMFTGSEQTLTPPSSTGDEAVLFLVAAVVSVVAFLLVVGLYRESRRRRKRHR
jgi:hypothetical protein